MDELRRQKEKEAKEKEYELLMSKYQEATSELHQFKAAAGLEAIEDQRKQLGKDIATEPVVHRSMEEVMQHANMQAWLRPGEATAQRAAQNQSMLSQQAP